MTTPLKKVRMTKGFTLEQVAEAVGSDSGNISRIERGKQNPNKEMVAKLVKLFETEGLTELQILFPERYTD